MYFDETFHNLIETNPDFVNALNVTYSTNVLRYIVTGSAIVPNLVYVARAAEELVLGLEGCVLE